MKKTMGSELGKVKVKSLSHLRLLATPRTVAHQAPPSMGFSRQEYWSWVPLPSPLQCYRSSSPHVNVIYGNEATGVD